MAAFAVGARGASYEIVREEPTFMSLGVEVTFADMDLPRPDVEVQYRKAGEGAWRDAMPLWRVDTTGQIKKVPSGKTLYAGSVMGLEPATAYEGRLTWTDASGKTSEEVLAMSTRSDPEFPREKRERFVVPGGGGGTGTKDDPFRGLAAAQAAAEPGDLFMVGAGTYKGTWTLTKSGTPDRPIIWLGPQDNSAVIDGAGGERAVSAEGIRDVWFVHLSITNAEYAVAAHRSSGILMRYCHVYDVDNGFVATRNPLKRNAVLDCVFEGRVVWEQDGKHVTPYTGIVRNGEKLDITDMHAVNVSGEGTVVAYNRMRNWGDAIHGAGDQPKVANDFYGNEISECADDGIEADYGAQNVRVFDNRITNVFQGISTQPVFGGPVYIFRNAIYNVNVEPFKLHNSPHGVLIINNTTVRAPDTEGGPMFVWTQDPIYNVFAANNLFVGGGTQYALEFSPALTDCRFDYNGYAGGPFANFAKWNKVVYATLAQFAKAGQEQHGVILTPKGLFASGAMPPENPETDFAVCVNDLRLAPGTAAIDAGKTFPCITDAYAGKAPDLGAYELGTPLPHYGPREEK